MVNISQSKLFRLKGNRDKIACSLSSPVNKELVMQLKQYVDFSELTDNHNENSSHIDTDKDSAHIEESNPDIDTNASNDDLPLPKDEDTSFDQPSAENKLESDPPIEDPKEEEPHEDDNPDNLSLDAQSSDGDVESSQCAVNSDYVKSATIGYDCQKPASIDWSQICNQLLGMLNLKDDTCGVIRCSVRNNELWIYYKDDINLNAVMNRAIDLISAANYYYLQFNRLARGSNAIVFDIDNQVADCVGD